MSTAYGAARRARLLLAGALAALAVVAATATAAGGDVEVTLPDPTRDIGTGEDLLIVVGGDYATREEAEAATERLDFLDLQGFFIVPGADLSGFDATRWYLASAFRTAEGAAAFAELARIAGTSEVRTVRARYGGTAWIGLGLEPHPDGTGPLIGPLRGDLVS